jgi:hypothetical protein
MAWKSENHREEKRKCRKKKKKYGAKILKFNRHFFAKDYGVIGMSL